LKKLFSLKDYKLDKSSRELSFLKEFNRWQRFYRKEAGLGEKKFSSKLKLKKSCGDFVMKSVNQKLLFLEKLAQRPEIS